MDRMEEMWSSTRALDSTLEEAAAAALQEGMEGGTGSAPAPEPPPAVMVVGGMLMSPDSPLAEALRMATVAAGRDCPVYLRGESGSGKELLARHLHDRSARRHGPWVAVNCGALPPQLIESELFGHKKGAFTGAFSDHPGKFRAASGGTLFLDEVGDMPLAVQTKLLRALQERIVNPVGETREYPVDFRLICATHKDLAKEVREGRFREDLYYRMAVVEIRVPPLRDRPRDLPLLLGRFLEAELGPAEAHRALASLPPVIRGWGFPGNVRELRNLAERYAVMRQMGGGWSEAWRAGGGTSEPVTVLPEARSGPGVEDRVSRGLPAEAGNGPVRNSRATDAEILIALESCGWHRTRASERLGMTRRALQYRLAHLSKRTPAAHRGDGAGG